MSVTIDEVTAEVAPPEASAPAPRREPQPAAPSELRRQFEQFDRRLIRAARVKAD